MSNRQRWLENLADYCRERQFYLGCAESCTGGLLASVITALPGSSHWFDGGLVCYSNRAKQAWLGVPAPLLQQEGAVSLPVAEAMVAGLLAGGAVQLAVAITGIAGPQGGSIEKPVGTVCFGFYWPQRGIFSQRCWFDGDREAVRQQSVDHALRVLLGVIDTGSVNSVLLSGD